MVWFNWEDMKRALRDKDKQLVRKDQKLTTLITESEKLKTELENIKWMKRAKMKLIKIEMHEKDCKMAFLVHFYLLRV